MPQVIGALAVTFATWGVGAELSLFLAQATVRLLTSVALGALASSLAKNSKTRNLPSGLRTPETMAGGLNPTSFVIGTYATAGYAVCPPMSHGVVGKTPNAYLTYVLEIGDIRRMAVTRVIIDGEYVTLSAGVDADGFYAVQGRFLDYARIKFYDGTQTTADPWLLTTYGSYPSRPWTSDMIGRDQCYAIVVMKVSNEVWNGLPQIRFETSGIPLYDPRADTTVGGSGPQRWATPTTWVASTNPMVQAYNIFRGISFVDGVVWGGGIPAEDLPLTEWFAAMNACDVATPILSGGTQPAYRSGLEVHTSDEPMAILEEIGKAAACQFVDMGGIWKPKVGAVGLPVMFITDTDVVVSKSQELDPFPNLSDTFNGVSATYPEPISLYEGVAAPTRLNGPDEVADGNRRLIADLSLSAVPYKDQVQRLMKAYRKDNRRFRRHGLTLGPSALLLEPTDSISWTSEWNGYTAKIFEVNSLGDDPMSVLQRIAVREKDATDYDWNAVTDTRDASQAAMSRIVPAALAVPTPSAFPVTLTGDPSGITVPTIGLAWDPADLVDIDSLKYQVRKVSASVSVRGSTADVDSGTANIGEGLIPNTNYEVRMRLVSKKLATSWTSWLAVTTGSASILSSSVVMSGGGTLPDYMGFASRAAFVAWAALNTPAVGSFIPAVGFTYQYLGTGTSISDLPGWIPAGKTYPDHWKQNTTPGTTDMGPAMASAIGYAGTIYLSGTTYATAQSLSFNSVDIVGEQQQGAGSSIIKGLSASIPIGSAILAPGRSSRVFAVRIIYDTITGSETQDQRVGIDTRGLSQLLQRGSSIDQVRFDNVGTAISDYGSGEFSVTYGTIEIAKHSFRAVDLRGPNRTGSVWLNVYINGADNYTPQGGFYSTGQVSGGFIGQMNIEHQAYTGSALLLEGHHGLVINSLHIEGVDATVTGKGYISLDSSSVTIHSLNVLNTRMTTDDTAVVRLHAAGYLAASYSSPPPTTTMNEKSTLKIGKLHLKGLAAPDTGIYPSYPAGRRGVRNCPGFNVFKRDTSYTDVNFSVEVDEYICTVFSGQVLDQPYLEFPATDYTGTIIFPRMGRIGPDIRPYVVVGTGASGAAGEVETWQSLASNAAAITTTTFGNVLTLTGVGVGTWNVEVHLRYQTAATTTGIRTAVQHTGTLSAFVSQSRFVSTGTAAATGVGDQVASVGVGQLVEGKSERAHNTGSSGTQGADTANADMYLIVNATLIVTATGSLVFRMASEVAASGVTAMAGTHMILRKIA